MGDNRVDKVHIKAKGKSSELGIDTGSIMIDVLQVKCL